MHPRKVLEAADAILAWHGGGGSGRHRDSSPRQAAAAALGGEKEGLDVSNPKWRSGLRVLRLEAGAGPWRRRCFTIRAGEAYVPES